MKCLIKLVCFYLVCFAIKKLQLGLKLIKSLKKFKNFKVFFFIFLKKLLEESFRDNF